MGNQTIPSRKKVPHLAEGRHDTGPRENAIFVGGKRAGVVYHPKPWQRVARVTSNSTAVIAKEYEQR